METRPSPAYQTPLLQYCSALQPRGVRLEKEAAEFIFMGMPDNHRIMINEFKGVPSPRCCWRSWWMG